MSFYGIVKAIYASYGLSSFSPLTSVEMLGKFVHDSSPILRVSVK
jgi:hypothetical protein